MGVQVRRHTMAILHFSEGQGGAPSSASSMLGWWLCLGKRREAEMERVGSDGC